MKRTLALTFIALLAVMWSVAAINAAAPRLSVDGNTYPGTTTPSSTLPPTGSNAMMLYWGFAILILGSAAFYAARRPR